MACELKPTCKLFFGFLWCSLPRDTIEIELTVRTVQWIHTFRKDHTVKMATCSPWSRWMKLFLSLQKKIEAYEEKRDEISWFHSNPNPFTKRSPFSKRSRENKQKMGKSKVRKLDTSRFAPPKAKMPANLWAPLPSAKATMITTTNTMPTTARPKMNTTLLCKTVGDPCPFAIKPDQPPPQSEYKDWTKEEEKKTRKNKVPNDYHPTSPVYDAIFKQDPLPQYTPKEKLAMDPDRYPPNYILEEEDSAPSLVNNLMPPPVEDQEKKLTKTNKGKRTKN